MLHRVMGMIWYSSLMITSYSEGEDERQHSLLNFAFRFEILYRFFLTGGGSSTASITGEEEQSFLPLDNNFAVGFLDELYHFFRIGEDTSLLSVSPTTVCSSSRLQSSDAAAVAVFLDFL
jgi:hypothetical protein